MQARVIALSDGGDLWEAITELDAVLAGWRVHPATARRMLVAAKPVFAAQSVAELQVQLEPEALLLTVELFDAEGTRVFGIDEWLGMDAPRPLMLDATPPASTAAAGGAR